MYDDPHIEDKLRGATPESQPPANINVDAIIREGARLRRRNRLVLGGTSAVAVAVLASVVAVATTFSPPAATRTPQSLRSRVSSRRRS
ncbi:hypothetical protein GCM10029992_27960 [Glycomyces albus]